MLNWDELKHIHVIRKLEEILGTWFATDIFFVDEKGQFRNWDPGDKRQFTNPMTSILADNENGQRVLMDWANKYGEKLFRAEKQNMLYEGFLGPEKVLVSRIVVDNE